MVNDLAQGHSGLLTPTFNSNVNFLRKTVSSIAGVFSASRSYLRGVIFFSSCCCFAGNLSSLAVICSSVTTSRLVNCGRSHVH